MNKLRMLFYFSIHGVCIHGIQSLYTLWVILHFERWLWYPAPVVVSTQPSLSLSFFCTPHSRALFTVHETFLVQLNCTHILPRTLFSIHHLHGPPYEAIASAHTLNNIDYLMAMASVKEWKTLVSKQTVSTWRWCVGRSRNGQVYGSEKLNRAKL